MNKEYIRVYWILFFFFIVSQSVFGMMSASNIASALNQDQPKEEDVDEVLKTLENPEKRAKLIKKLKILKEVNKKDKEKPHVIETTTNWTVSHIESFIEDSYNYICETGRFPQELMNALPKLNEISTQQKMALLTLLFLSIFLICYKLTLMSFLLGAGSLIGIYGIRRYFDTPDNPVIFPDDIVHPIIVFGVSIAMSTFLQKLFSRFPAHTSHHAIRIKLLHQLRLVLFAVAGLFGLASAFIKILLLAPKSQLHWLNCSYLIISIVLASFAFQYRGVVLNQLKNYYSKRKTHLGERFKYSLFKRWYAFFIFMLLLLNFSNIFTSREFLLKKIALWSLITAVMLVIYYFIREVKLPKTKTGALINKSMKRWDSYPLIHGIWSVVYFPFYFMLWGLYWYFMIKVAGVELNQLLQSQLFYFFFIKIASLYVSYYMIKLGWHSIYFLEEWVGTKETISIKHQTFAKTFFPILKKVLQSILIFIGVILFLGVFEIPVMPLLYSLSVVGAAIALGSQTFFKDLITGFLTLLDGNIAVGDVVKIKTDLGTIEGISMRSLQLRHPSGNLQTIPFSEVSTIINYSRDYHYCSTSIVVSYETNLEAVYTALQNTYKIIKEQSPWKEMILEDLVVKGSTSFNDKGVQISSYIKTTPDPFDSMQQAFFVELKKELDKQGVVLPNVWSYIKNAPLLPVSDILEPINV